MYIVLKCICMQTFYSIATTPRVEIFGAVQTNPKYDELGSNTSSEDSTLNEMKLCMASW